MALPFIFTIHEVLDCFGLPATNKGFCEFHKGKPRNDEDSGELSFSYCIAESSSLRGRLLNTFHLLSSIRPKQSNN